MLTVVLVGAYLCASGPAHSQPANNVIYFCTLAVNIDNLIWILTYTALCYNCNNIHGYDELLLGFREKIMISVLK